MRDSSALRVARQLPAIGLPDPLSAAELAMYGLYSGSLRFQAHSFQRYTEMVALVTLSVTCSRLSSPRLGMALLSAAYAIKLRLTLLFQLGR